VLIARAHAWRHKVTPVQTQFWEELKTHPNIPYKPFGAGAFELIPPEYP
jgi:arylsulfatase